MIDFCLDQRVSPGYPLWELAGRNYQSRYLSAIIANLFALDNGILRLWDASALTLAPRRDDVHRRRCL